MSAFIRKLSALINSLEGYMYKFAVDTNLSPIPPLTKDYDGIIISLTSYGRRVSNNVVFYTLVSLLRQRVQPSRIILWLAKDEWSDDKLPKKLSSLKDKGVEIRYCDDIRSFKKLVPTLEICPDGNIVTVDDDMIYNSDFISQISEAHQKYPNDIICMDTRIVQLEDGIPTHYDRWGEYAEEVSGKMVFPVGVGGILYPAGSLNKDVLRKDLFMKLCPLADDIWFWFQGLRNSTNKRYVRKKHRDLTFDALYQFFHKGSALTHSNYEEHQNDRQFRDLFEFDGVKVDDKGNIINTSC